LTVPLIDRELPADASAVSSLRHLVVHLARHYGAGGAALDRIAIAISEAVSNVVLHAYEPGDEGVVHFAADVERGDLQVLVSDHGHGFRPRNSAGLGLGLPLIAQNSSDFSITETVDGVDVWMRFVVPAS
jgi:anti-sigma regulatory factor (Ser/Thr protein kinase)